MFNQQPRFNHSPVNKVEGIAGDVTFSSNDASITFTISGNNIDFSATGGGGPGTPYYAWQHATGATNLVSGNGYVADSASLLPFTLPATAAIGDHFKIAGYGAGGWSLLQNASQTIHFSSVDTTTGAGGSIASQNRYDGIEIVCVKANTDFVVVAAQDSLTVV